MSNGFTGFCTGGATQGWLGGAKSSPERFRKGRKDGSDGGEDVTVVIAELAGEVRTAEGASIGVEDGDAETLGAVTTVTGGATGAVGGATGEMTGATIGVGAGAG